MNYDPAANVHRRARVLPTEREDPRRQPRRRGCLLTDAQKRPLRRSTAATASSCCGPSSGARARGGSSSSLGGLLAGCMDPTAASFDASARMHNRTRCRYAVRGCADPSAANYNPLASVSDGSCVHAAPRAHLRSPPRRGRLGRPQRASRGAPFAAAGVARGAQPQSASDGGRRLVPLLRAAWGARRR